MNFKKKFLWLMLITFMLFVNGCFNGNFNSKNDLNNETVINNTEGNKEVENEKNNEEITIEKITYKDEENGKVYNIAEYDKIKIPQNVAEKYPELVKVINKFNDENDSASKEFIKSYYSEIREMILERHDEYLEYSSSNTISLNRHDDKVFSFIYNVSSYTGGAHGSASFICYNFNPKNGMKYKNSDVFTDMNKLYESIIIKLKEYEDNNSLFPEYKDTLKDIFNNNETLNFIIKDNSVDLIFDPYILGPWASGPIMVTFDKEKDGNLLNMNLFN